MTVILWLTAAALLGWSVAGDLTGRLPRHAGWGLTALANGSVAAAIALSWGPVWSVPNAVTCVFLAWLGWTDGGRAALRSHLAKGDDA